MTESEAREKLESIAARGASARACPWTAVAWGFGVGFALGRFPWLARRARGVLERALRVVLG